MAVRQWLVILILFLYAFPSMAQSRIDAGITLHRRVILKNVGWDPGANGASLDIHYEHPLPGAASLRAGISTGFNLIAGFTGVELGAFHQVTRENTIPGISFGIVTFQGAALFQQQLIYMMGILPELDIYLETPMDRRVVIFIQPGYITAPGYERYSSLNAFFSLDAGLRFSFPLLPDKTGR